jgi:hypothetical protein
MIKSSVDFEKQLHRDRVLSLASISQYNGLIPAYSRGTSIKLNWTSTLILQLIMTV